MSTVQTYSFLREKDLYFIRICVLDQGIYAALNFLKVEEKTKEQANSEIV